MSESRNRATGARSRGKPAAIELSGVGKRYVQSVERPMLVKRLVGLERRRRHELWALRDVSFSCEPGSTVGVIGRNGSGKTTLLRLLAGVSAPTEGRLRIVGRIAPLIGVGVGFNQELTGHENVLVNGQLLGMTEAEVRERTDAIIQFADMAEFMDTPVKYYSSGMFLRLAFSVAIHTDPDVFLIDEVLAVGDAAFQLKCLERLRAAQERGTTIVVVTHNLQLLQQLAPRAILLSQGRVVFDGDVDAALSEYQATLQREELDRASDSAALLSGSTGGVIGGAQVSVELCDEFGEPASSYETGETVVARLTAQFGREIDRPRVGIVITTIDRGAVFTVATYEGGYDGTHGPDRPLSAEFRLVNHLLARTYLVQVAVYEQTGAAVVGVSAPRPMVVTPGPRVAGLVDMEPVVTVQGQEIPVGRVQRLAGERGSGRL